MRRQRLGILLHDFSLGGTERIALRLAGEWTRRGREVSIFCGDPQGALRAGVPEGIRVISPLKPIARAWTSRRQLGVWAGAACRSAEIEGLFIPGNFHFASLPALSAGRSSAMVLVCKLSNPVKRPDRSPLAQQYSQMRMATRLRNADAVVAMSTALAEDARIGLGGLPFMVIEEPILDDHPPDGDDPPAERQGIVAAGRFVPQKNFGLAVQALARVADQEANLTIVGDGAELKQVREIARNMGLAERVHLPGRVSDVRQFLRGSRVLLLSSRYEGFPAIAVEALANGARIVATDCSPAIREIISSPDFGEIVPTRDPLDLAAAVDRQLNEAPVARRAIGRLHRRFGLGRSAQRYLELFDSL
ncbi:MAG TPA: glycosyltransferase [Bauldia sp.]|nr:glycosyltransferase [Bauldia sp.]